MVQSAKADSLEAALELSTLTPAVQRAIVTAQYLAKEAGEPEVRPRHLLHALLQEEEGLAATLLKKAGLSSDTLRRTFDAARGCQPLVSFDPVFALALHTEGILRTAGEIAFELTGERTAAGDHVVVAMLRLHEEIRAELQSVGLDFTRLEESVFGRLPVLTLDEPLELTDTAEQVGASRVLDAAGNRAREALRVVEDYCRFVLDDSFLCRELKQLRHDLTEALAVAGNGLIAARDTLADVGTAINTLQEQARVSIMAVVEANFKRLQEALRSVEEFSKLRSRLSGLRVEQLRYRSYTLERAVWMGAGGRQRLSGVRLYVLISSAQCTADLEWTIQEAAAGGAQIFQLREKHLDDRKLLEQARRVRQATRNAGCLLIVNDRPDIARLVGADGVHLGQDDLPLKEARCILGTEGLIGVSTHTIEQVRHAVLHGASYIGLGPVFPSATKGFAVYPGLDFVRAAVAETSLPAFSIGGVNLETIGAAVAAGAERVAVSEAVCKASDPRSAAAQMRSMLDEAVAAKS
jgi:thiamine-phosphate pyrophosphorylase